MKVGKYGRFWSKVDKSAGESACWPWLGCIKQSKSGYRWGDVKVRRRHWAAARWAWVLAFGGMPSGLCVLHRCDNGICCNPSHLFLGTNADNIRDSVEKGRKSQGENHFSAKLNNAAVAAIRAEYPNVANMATLARRYWVSLNTISLVVHRKTWKRQAAAA